MHVLMETLHKTLDSILPRIVELRRSIHQEPELSREEHLTAQKVQEVLADFPLNLRTNLYGTGMIADIQVPGKRRIAFRGDMDALPIHEATGLPYASRIPGVMHACGHDFHTAIITGTAMVLSKLQRELPGPVRFLFQPSEEDNPRGGARGMIDAGALEGVSALFGLHLWPDLPSGCIESRPGPLMAASDHVTLTLRGIGSHAAKPHLGIDAVLTAAHVITGLQSLISRRKNPFEPAVLTFGRIEGGSRYNVVADTVVLDGTCRTFNPEIRDFLEQEIPSLASSVAQGFGASCEGSYERGYPSLHNSEELYQKTHPLLNSPDFSKVLKFRESVEPSMVAEDFAYYAEQVPALFFWLGCRPPEATPKNYPPLHNAHFTPDEKVLRQGIFCNAFLALQGLLEP